MGSQQQSESEHFSPYRSDGKLYGFVCIVTGATQLIGRAVVHELAAHGAAVVYACSTEPSDDYTSLADEVNAQYPSTKVIGYPFKLADEQATLALIDDVLNAWGRLDIYATISTHPSTSSRPSLASTTPASLHACLEANTTAPFLALKYAPAAMRKTTPKGNYANAAPKDQVYGSIVLVVDSPVGFDPAFTIASHAARGVVKAGVPALKGSGIRINSVSAGGVSASDGEKEGAERRGSPVEVARVVGFLASGFSSFVTGSDVVVDGGRGVLGSLGAV